MSTLVRYDISMQRSLFAFALFCALTFFSQQIVFAQSIAPGCRVATAEDNAQLAARGLPPVAQICPQDENLIGVGKDFEQWYQQLKTQSPCNKNTCNLACRTRNTGAQVCGATSKKWGSIGCHPNNNTAIFPTVAHGFAAHIELLRRYCGERNRCTINSVVQQWTAIAGDRPAYANFVSKNSGIPANQVFNPNDIDTVARLALSMACFEGGAMPFPVDQLKQGLVMAGGGAKVPVPQNVGQLLNESLYGSGFAGTLNQATGGALGNSPLGQFLGLQPSASQSTGATRQTPISGVAGGAVAPTYAGVGSTNPGGSSLGSVPSVTGAGVSATGSPVVSLPLTDAVLGGDTLLTGTQGQATTTASQTINLNAPLGPIKNAPPTLLCIPGVVEPNEEALLFWSCNDASTSAEVDASTDESCEALGKTSGVMCARPASSTTYTLACNAGTSAQCLIQVIQPRLAIIATPRSVVRGGVVDITWDTDDVSDCVVKSSTHPTFNRVGITGDVTSPSIYQDTTFTLLCEAETGTIKKKEIVVDVL